jgi:hypothetical protein
MSSHLRISMSDMVTMISYVVDGKAIVAHTHDVGLQQLEADGLGTLASSRLMDGVLYTLEFISLYDRIPTDFKLETNRYATWITGVLEKGSYTQFYTSGKPVRVTLESTKGPSITYARHTKTLLSFKV